MTKINNALIIVGGTGGLGYEVAKGLRTAEGFDAYKAIVRNPESEKAKGLEEMGWSLTKLDDYSNADDLQAALSDARVVVSTLSGGDMVTLEKSIIDAAKRNGTNMFVPSQFGVDYRRWGTEFPFLAGKKAVLDYAKEQDMKTLAVFNGLFADWIFDFLATPSEAKARIIGDGSGKVSFTKRSDIGYVLAKALADPDLGDTLSMQGTTMAYKDALEVLSKVLGKKLDIETIPADEAKSQELSLLEKGLKGDMGSFFGSFGLHLLGEPQRGNKGCDTSAESKTYGVEMTSLEATLKDIYKK